jgi:outer membrane protein TolC
MKLTHSLPICLGISLAFSPICRAQNEKTPPRIPVASAGVIRDANVPSSLDLATCLNLALRRNTDILKAQQEIKRLHGLIVEVRAEALPQVALVGAVQTEDNELANGQFGGFAGAPNRQQSFWNAGIQVNQLLYNGGAVNAALDIARLSESNAFHQLDATIDATVFLIREAYYNVLVTRSLISVREATVKLLQEELQNQERRLNAGTVTRFNVLRAEVELANAQPPLIRARNLYKISLVNLAKLLAIDYDAAQLEPPFKVIGELSYRPTNFKLEEVLRAAASRRPEIQLANQQIAIQRRQLTIDRSGLLPRVSAFAGYDVISDRNKSNFDATNPGWSVGLQGNWNIFDGFRVAGKLEQTKANIEIAKLDADQTQRDIDAEARQAYYDFVEARELILSQQKNVEQAVEALRLANSRFDVGAATQLDVLNANVALTDARTNELEARYDYNIAVSRVERVTSAPVLDRSSALVPSRTQRTVSNTDTTPADNSPASSGPVKKR